MMVYAIVLQLLLGRRRVGTGKFAATQTIIKATDSNIQVLLYVSAISRLSIRDR